MCDKAFREPGAANENNNSNKNENNKKQQVNLLTDDIEKFILTSRGRKQLEQSTHILRNYAMNSASGVTDVKTNRLSSLMQILSSLSHYENNMKMMPILLKVEINMYSKKSPGQKTREINFTEFFFKFRENDLTSFLARSYVKLVFFLTF